MKIFLVLISLLLASCRSHLELTHQGLSDAEAFLSALGTDYHFGPEWIPAAGALDFAIRGRTEIMILY